MTQITIPNIEERTLQELKQLAWRRGLPLEESLRRLLEEAVETDIGRWEAKRLRNNDAEKAISAAAAKAA